MRKNCMKRWRHQKTAWGQAPVRLPEDTVTQLFELQNDMGTMEILYHEKGTVKHGTWVHFWWHFSHLSGCRSLVTWMSSMDNIKLLLPLSLLSSWDNAWSHPAGARLPLILPNHCKEHSIKVARYSPLAVNLYGQNLTLWARFHCHFSALQAPKNSIPSSIWHRTTNVCSFSSGFGILSLWLCSCSKSELSLSVIPLMLRITLSTQQNPEVSWKEVMKMSGSSYIRPWRTSCQFWVGGN